MYIPFEKYIYRTPLLPFEYLRSALEHSQDINIWMKNETVKEAIFLASPVLFKEIKKYLSGDISEESDKLKILLSFMKYFSRMCTRCTPFGLFATCSAGEMGDNIEFQMEDNIERKTRLDMYFLCKLAQHLTNIHEIRCSLKYFPNTTINIIGKYIHYIEYKYQNERRIHIVSSLEKNQILCKVLELASNGITLNEINDYLYSLKFTKDEISEYVNLLIDLQLLVSELDVNVTGDSYTYFLVRLLQSKNFNSIEVTELINVMKDVLFLLESIDKRKSRNNISIYQECINKIKRLKLPVDERFLFQVDATRVGGVTYLRKEYISDEINKIIPFIGKLFHTQNVNPLKSFTKLFYERYEFREIPLAQALDPAIGIGYPPSHGIADLSPMIEKLVIPKKNEQNNNGSFSVNSVMIRKLQEMQLKKNKEVIFTDEDVKELPNSECSLASTIYCIFQLLKEKNGNYIFNIKSIGSNAANLLSRFSYLNKDIDKLVKDISNFEKDINKDIILAEIAHLPSSRVGNILSRPHLRDYEIVYLSGTDMHGKGKILISDLMLSYKNGELVLRSKKLNKRVFPRLTSAHNFYNDTLPIYRFLCDLQYQNVDSNRSFDWGGIYNVLNHFPRVRYRNSILSLEMWKVRRYEIEEVKQKNKKFFFDEVRKWRIKKEMPRYVLLVNGDNDLFVDFDSDISINMLFSVIKHQEILTFKEFIFDEFDGEVIKGKNGRYINEFIVPFYNTFQ